MQRLSGDKDATDPRAGRVLGNAIPLTGDALFTLGKVPLGYFKVVLTRRDSSERDHTARCISRRSAIASRSSTAREILVKMGCSFAPEPAAFRSRPMVKRLSSESGLLLYQADRRATRAPEGRVPGY